MLYSVQTLLETAKTNLCPDSRLQANMTAD